MLSLYCKTKTVPHLCKVNHFSNSYKKTAKKLSGWGVKIEYGVHFLLMGDDFFSKE